VAGSHSLRLKCGRILDAEVETLKRVGCRAGFELDTTRTCAVGGVQPQLASRVGALVRVVGLPGGDPVRRVRQIGDCRSQTALFRQTPGVDSTVFRFSKPHAMRRARPTSACFKSSRACRLTDFWPRSAEHGRGRERTGSDRLQIARMEAGRASSGVLLPFFRLFPPFPVTLLQREVRLIGRLSVDTPKCPPVRPGPAERRSRKLRSDRRAA
jgi:hypothetical protein